MKIIERIRKDLVGIGTILLTIPTKVFAIGIGTVPSVQPVYGVQEPEPVRSWNICRMFIIPIALLIGIIIYFKKSKSTRKKKIVVTIGIAAITAILYFVVNTIIYA